MSAVLSLSVVSLSFASTEQFAAHLGEEKLSEISSGSYKCEFTRGNIEKESRGLGVVSISAPASSGSSKARMAR